MVEFLSGTLEIPSQSSADVIEVVFQTFRRTPKPKDPQDRIWQKISCSSPKVQRDLTMSVPFLRTVEFHRLAQYWSPALLATDSVALVQPPNKWLVTHGFRSPEPPVGDAGIAARSSHSDRRLLRRVCHRQKAKSFVAERSIPQSGRGWWRSRKSEQ
jgi:hypothetical protein